MSVNVLQEQMAKSVASLEEVTVMAKARVKAYTRKDGTMVKEHDNGRAAAAPKPAAGGGEHLGQHKVGDRVSYKGERGSTRTGKVKGVRDGKVIVEHKAGYTELKHHSELSGVAGKPGASDPYGHPNVVGKPSKMVRYQWTKETGTKEVPHDGKPTDADEIEFAGRRYRTSSKTGKSMHDDTPVRRFAEDNGTDEGGHHVWLDDQGRVHADSTSEVAGLRAKHEAHAKKGGGGKKASSASLDHKRLVDAATYSGGQYEEHSATTTDRHSSRSIRVGKDKEKAHEHAHEALMGAGLKPAGKDSLTGAHQYESDTHTAEISHDNGTMHVSVKRKG